MKRFNGFFLMATIFVVCLMTAPASATLQSPVPLGSNSTFAILAGTTVTVTGGGTITGNIGIFPGTAYVAGTPPVTVNGTIYAGGPVAAQAQADLSTAFNDAAGRQTPVIVSGNIGGQTLTAGLYKSTSSLAVSSGDLTLDAQGNSNAVFIFQIASTFTMTSGRQVILAGGANAANIFWQVGSSATIGTTAVLHGNILAAISISMLTGSTLDGRALAQGGAVTVDTGGGSSATVPGSPTVPTVISTAPANGAAGVPINDKITATFSTAMDPTTITTSTFTLLQGATPVAGSVTYAGTTATFTPSTFLLSLAPYSATITTGAKDQAGTALASSYVWTFTTGATSDITPPTVTSTVPLNGATGVPIGSKLSASFSEAIDPNTITTTTFTLQQAGTAVPGSVTYVGTVASFTPSSALASLTTYTATVTTGVKDLAGNALASNFVWSFTTSAVLDTVPPFVISTIPANAEKGVAASATITASFSEMMDPLTITTATFTLQQGSVAVAGTVTYVATTATFTPSILLSPNTVYTATITTGAKDLAGNALTGNYVWIFTTRASPVPVLTPVIFPVNTTGNPSGTLNDASFTTPVAAGSIAAVFGSNLAIGQANSQVPTPLPTSLAQSSFSIGGRAAPLFFASPSQVNVQIPWELAGQTEATISATVGGVVSNIQKVNIAPFAPGIFTINATGSGQGAVLIAPTAQLAAPGTAVQRSAYISIFCTGLGAVSVQPANGAAAQGSALSYTLTLPTVTIGGVSALVTYSGLAPNWAGLYQVNAQVPASVSPGSTVSVVLSIGGATSNTVTIAVQ